MANENLNYLNYTMLSNPLLNPFGYSQHLNPADNSAKILDNPIITYMATNTVEDSFKKEKDNNENITKEPQMNATYTKYLNKKQKQGVLFGLIGGGTAISSAAAFKVSQFGKKNPWIMAALGVIGTVGSIIGFSQAAAANKDLEKYQA